jgi:nucleotide-binding universal stress UspA family protein
VVCQARAGNPGACIADYAREIGADLIIIGRHNETPNRPSLLGSAPAKVLQLARCSVLVVQPTNY